MLVKEIYPVYRIGNTTIRKISVSDGADTR